MIDASEAKVRVASLRSGYALLALSVSFGAEAAGSWTDRLSVLLGFLGLAAGLAVLYGPACPALHAPATLIGAVALGIALALCLVLPRGQGSYATRSRKLYRPEGEGGGPRGEGGPAGCGLRLREGAPPLLGAVAEAHPRGRPAPLPQLRRGDADVSACPTKRAARSRAITDPAVVDRILAHLEATGGHDPFDARAPPEG